MGLWTWKRRTIGPIGLDIGHDSVKMLQLSGDGQTLSVHRLIRRRLPASCEDEQIQRQGLILTIRRMLEEGDFHGLQAAVCLANDKLKVTSIRLPESDVTQTTAQLYKEAALRFGLDPGQDPIHYIPAGTVRQGDQIRQEVILLATGRQAVEEDLAVLDQVGLTAVGLEPMPCALVRGFHQTGCRDEDPGQTHVLLDVGRRFTTVVFSQGGEIAFVKVIPLGMERFDTAIAAKLGVKPEEAETLRKTWRAVEAEGAVEQTLSIEGGPDGSDLSYPSSGHPKSLDPSVHRMLTDTLRSVAETLAREVSLCVRYYTVTFRGHRIDRLWVSGGGAYEPFVMTPITVQVGVECERARPLRGMKGLPDAGDETAQEGGSEWAVSLGLALKGGWATPCPAPGQSPESSCVPVV